MDRIWLGTPMTKPTDPLLHREGTGVITDLVPITYKNWDYGEDLSGADHQFNTCDEVDYTYDYAQLWRINGDRRWHE